jgi:hypothetical protein
MNDKKRTFLVDGYQAKPNRENVTRGYQANPTKPSSETSKPPSSLPRTTSVVSKPKGS